MKTLFQTLDAVTSFGSRALRFAVAASKRAALLLLMVVAVAFGCACAAEKVDAYSGGSKTITRDTALNLQPISPDLLQRLLMDKHEARERLVESIRARTGVNADLRAYLDHLMKGFETAAEGDSRLISEIRRHYESGDQLYFYSEKKGATLAEGWIILNQAGQEKYRIVLGEGTTGPLQ